MALSSSATRIIDPILTNVIQGYANSELIGNTLFPPVPVTTSGGQIIEFGKEALKLFSARRAPGGATRRMQMGYLGKPFALVQDSLEALVPREYLRDASIVPGIDLATRAVMITMRSLQLQLEVDQATLALDTSKYATGSYVNVVTANQWDNKSAGVSTASPLEQIDVGREKIRSLTGIYPNVLVLSAKAFNAAKNNTNVIARLQYNAQVSPDATTITPQMLAGLFNVDKVVVGRALYFKEVGAVDTSYDIWGAEALLAYVPTQSLGIEEPSFGYTYTMAGNPTVEQPYFDNNSKSWVYGVNYERVPVLSGIASGYLMKTVCL